MNRKLLAGLGAGLTATLAAALVVFGPRVNSDPIFLASSPPVLAQVPLYLKDAVPPLNMLVMGKDHKIYYEAYNDASDLNGDGVLDIGYRGWETEVVNGTAKFKIDYYGYFNSYACYTYETANGGRFVPVSATSNKKCGGTAWSGDFLNYLTTSRMDALRRVLYGGWRQVDTATDTTLQGAYFPQDAHSWGKEYQSVARDGYDIRDYAPLSLPGAGKYHLFAVTTFTDPTAPSAPVFRVLRNSSVRVWNWLSIEGPVAGSKCFNAANQRIDCVGGGGWEVVPATALSNVNVTTWKHSAGHPGDRAGMDSMFAANAVSGKLCGSGAATVIDKPNTGNPFNGNNGCTNDNYLSRITAKINITVAGTYQFAVDGDDAVDLTIDGTAIVGWYGGHGGDRSQGGLDSHSGSIYLSVGAHDVSFRHEEGSGGDSWGLFWKDASGASGFEPDLNVRVQACPSNTALQDATCKTYPSGVAKPTGILHDYGETNKMYFGLIAGSQFNNLEGGVLRKNISNFASEIDAQTGQFLPGNGIANTLSQLRMIGGGYDSGAISNAAGDSNWNWGNKQGDCAGTGNAISNGNCRMWGNPVAEMMFEGLRYFAGARSPTARFASGGSGNGRAEETTMGLAQDTWKDPYGTGPTGLGYPRCAKPFETVVADINASYDGDLPGSAFASIPADSTVSGFNASTEAGQIWANEFGAGSRAVFIGEANGVSDGAPTAKTASTFANIRGLSPEEPTKNGTYYAASVARYGFTNDINTALGLQQLGIYSVALASPLPRIQFPVNGRNITIIPFGKTVSGTFGGGSRKPTNTIVDFYVQQIVNLPGQPSDASVNGGLPYAVFRINYEDVEQGNDHDMDAIVKYEVKANADSTVTVSLTSEYAAGSANQNMGYVISGTTRDGIYLEVRDSDNTDVPSSAYSLNTPAGVWAGGCASGNPPAVCNDGLPLTSTRTFAPSSAGSSVLQLRDPLWYAAKYGGFVDTNRNGLPDSGEWDRRKAGEPDNYFLVTNPLELRSQLQQAFDDITAQSGSPGNNAVSGARVSNGSYTLQPSFQRARDNADWYGTLSATAVKADGSLGSALWDAASRLPAAGSRRIFAIKAAGTAPSTTTPRDVVDFRASNLGVIAADQYAALGINQAQVASLYGGNYTPQDFVDYLRGDQSKEKGNGNNTLRQRGGRLGDIVNSEPVIVSPRSNFGYSMYSNTMFSGYDAYLTSKAGRTPIVLVGANDGMLHAFDGSTQACGPSNSDTCATATSGDEKWAVIPNSALGQLGKLPLPDRLFQHRYFVDGQIATGDVKDASGWTTVAVATAGAGGRSIFAVDVSSSTASLTGAQVLWELNNTTDTDLGYMLGRPVIAPLENGRWGVLFGNGYGGSRSDPSLYIVDAATGQLIRKITADDGAQGGANDPYNGLGNITAVDLDADGLVDTVYGGDLQGNVWKFNISQNTATAWGVAFSGSPLFIATEGPRTTPYVGANAALYARQPITGGITVSRGPGNGVMVFFGTGRYFVQGDNDVVSEPQVQSLYGIWDNGTAAGSRANLTRQKITSETTTGGITVRALSQNLVTFYGPGATRGWVVDLGLDADNDGVVTGTGERFVGKPRVQNGKVFFPTYAPLSSSCDPGGANFMYVLDLLSGSGSLANVKVLPNNTPACTNGDCGGIALQNGAPVTSVSVVVPDTQPNLQGLSCVAGSPGCPATAPTTPQWEECQVVVYPGALVLPRPCGRQSWRQLK